MSIVALRSPRAVLPLKGGSIARTCDAPYAALTHIPVRCSWTQKGDRSRGSDSIVLRCETGHPTALSGALLKKCGCIHGDGRQLMPDALPDYDLGHTFATLLAQL